MCLGLPGRIVEISDVAQQRVTVDVDGVRRDVSAALVGLEGPGSAQVGGWVLVHAGFVVEAIDERAAQEILADLQTLGDMYENELGDPSPVADGTEGAPPLTVPGGRG
ncbi:HypC/HybG/HupF family hydrogenase formation chaperone [Blastococcus saxobsidens]|uniref:Hydrogenase maturation protein HypC n=1 Tax=Blastococcus saxobsidens TaxID=138336 RepID=A0A4Q7Y764_9ACTN|nr:HypC/HybG/HupF family hydrogenase formation chaperone [Blastococcus saxobsidens]RZU31795.1 hydrogenase maturation protein HypC [Blastococcus saxobsidens]